MSGLTHSRVAAVAVLLLAAVLYGLSWGSFYVGYFNDDVIYIALARSLSRGSGYCDLEYVGAPAHGKYPPLLPVMLTPFQAVAPDALEAMRIVGVGGALAALALLIGWLAGASPRIRWGTALLLACNPFLVRYAPTVQSDALFMAMLILYLRVAQPFESTAPTPRQASLLGLLAALAFYLRSVGAVLVPATLLWMAVRRQGLRPMAAYVAVFTLAVAPWVVGRGLVGYRGDVTNGYTQQTWQAITGQNLGFYIPALPLALIADPMRFLVDLLGPSPSGPLWTLVVFTWALVGIGFAVREGRRPSLAGFLFVIYAGVFVMWPFRDVRFFLPVFPLLLLYLCCGADRLLMRSSPRRGPIVVSTLGVALGVWLVGLDLHNATHTSVEEASAPRETFAWVARNLPPGASVKACGAAIWLYTGRPVEALTDGIDTPEGAIRDALRGASEIVLIRTGEAPDASPPLWLEGFRQRPDLLAPVYANPTESAFVFRVTGDRARYLAAYDDFVRGVQLAQAEQIDASLQAFRECLARESDFPPAAFNLAYLTWKRGDVDSAERLLQGLLRRHPDHLRARSLLEAMGRSGPAPPAP